jgi:hypothetical protein
MNQNDDDDDDGDDGYNNNNDDDDDDNEELHTRARVEVWVVRVMGCEMKKGNKQLNCADTYATALLPSMQ